VEDVPRDNHIFIESELAAIAEAEARSALARLGNATGTEVAALKAILEKSKLINDAQKQSTKIVLILHSANRKGNCLMKIQKFEDKWYLYVLGSRYSSPKLLDCFKGCNKIQTEV
jgi:hypothetical protein